MIVEQWQIALGGLLFLLVVYLIQLWIANKVDPDGKLW